MNVQRVHVFSLTTPKKGTVKAKRRYRVKWRVDGRDWSQQFRVKAQAERLRSRLLVATDSGERFDPVSGRPVSWSQSELTWFDWSVRWVELKWPGWAGKSRYSGVEVVTVATPVLTKPGAPDAPENVRWWLRNYAYHPDTPVPDDEVLRWLQRWSLPLTEITPAVLEQLLGVICVRQDGSPAAANTAVRYKNMVASILTVAVKHGEIGSNPMDRVTWRPPKQDVAVDNSVLPSPADVEQLVTYTSELETGGRRYAAFFATCGYAGMRPSEAAGLEWKNLTLPDAGWGLAVLRGAITSPRARCSTSGTMRERKGLKHRSATAVREVPLPPQLVRWLRWHRDTFGETSNDGLVFTNQAGRAVTTDNYAKIWRRMRSVCWASQPRLLDTKVKDLRHVTATTWLQAGVPPAEAARRLGHSTEMLLRVYAGVFTEERDRSNQLIQEQLAEHSSDSG